MSMDFVIALSGPDAALSVCLPAMDDALLGLGFVLGSTVANACLDSARDVFDETEIELHGVQHLSQVRRQVSAWSGVALEYRRSDVGTLYVLVGRTVGEHLCVWVEIGERTFREAFRSSRQKEIYKAIDAVSSACGAVIGLGDLEQERRPQTASQLVDRLVRDGLVETVPPSRLYICRREVVERENLSLWTRADNTVYQAQYFCFLETMQFKGFWSR